MAIEKINIERFLELAQKYPLLDVRSPGEYKHAHIPGAYSLPLFSDEERKIVGTAYKQESREKAIKIGLDFFGPKMSRMVEEAGSIGSRPTGYFGHSAVSNAEISDTSTQSDQSEIANLKSKILLVYCWRGGMRSAGVAWLLDLYGFKVHTLAGGYKSFRKWVLETFKHPFEFRVLGGYTGSGKTELLQALEQKGEKVIDLESIANHKGSAFGSIGMSPQPAQEMFENLLAIELHKKLLRESRGKLQNKDYSADSQTPPIWIEDESQRIGLVNIPGDIWSNMRQSPISFLDIPFEERLLHIVREYGNLDKQKLTEAISRISEKLGGLNTKMAISLLEQGETPGSFRIQLEYYDKHYFRALHNRKDIHSLLHTIDCKSVTPENANQLVHLIPYQPQKD